MKAEKSVIDSVSADGKDRGRTRHRFRSFDRRQLLRQRSNWGRWPRVRGVLHENLHGSEPAEAVVQRQVSRSLTCHTSCLFRPSSLASYLRSHSISNLVAVLGNHDYRGDAEAQLSLVLAQIDWRWLCLRSFIVNAGKLRVSFSWRFSWSVKPRFDSVGLPELTEIFFVDTTPFVRSYFTDSKGHNYDWRAVKSRKSYIRKVLEVCVESWDLTVTVAWVCNRKRTEPRTSWNRIWSRRWGCRPPHGGSW